MVTEASTTDSRLAIGNTIASILDDVKKAAENGITLTESMTETIVIDRMLAALGYAVWEYQKQGTAEGIGNIPDYTILPKTPQQWFLEVKRWQLPLTEKEANQTVGYAFSQGSRWAILTNGDEWRIYDAHCKEHLTQKCIFTLKSLSSPDAVEMFSLLMKEAMKQDLLAASHRARLLAEAVRNELLTAGSETIKALRKAIQTAELPNVTQKEVLEAVGKLIDCAPPSCRIVYDIEQPQLTVDTSLTDNGTETPSIYDLSNNQPSPASKTVLSVILPDGNESPVKNWRDVVRILVSWYTHHHGIPELPFLGGSPSHASRFFLNVEPKYPDGKPWIAEDSISVAGKTIYVNLHNSALGFCRVVRLMCEAIGADSTAVKVRFK